LGRAQAGRQIAWIPEPDPAALAGLWPQLFGAGPVAGAVLVLGVLAWAAPGSRAARARVAAVSVAALAPPLLLWTASHGEVSYFHARYLLFTLPAWAVLAAAGLRAARLPGARPRRAGLAVLAVPAVLALLTLPEQGELRQPYAHFWHGVDHRGAAATVRAYHRPRDAVVYARGEDRWRLLDAGARHYLPRELRAPGVLPDVFLDRPAADRAELWASECADPARCLRARGAPRLWLLVPAGEADPLDALPPAQARALRARYTATGTERLTGVTVALLVRRAG
ncbi:hypothetical protein AB0C99_16880, partial [Streptomyces sp. NPDC048659]